MGKVVVEAYGIEDGFIDSMDRPEISLGTLEIRSQLY